MIIIGVDFHPEYQEIASVDTDTGEYQPHLAFVPRETYWGKHLLTRVSYRSTRVSKICDSRLGI